MAVHKEVLSLGASEIVPHLERSLHKLEVVFTAILDAGPHFSARRRRFLASWMRAASGLKLPRPLAAVTLILSAAP